MTAMPFWKEPSCKNADFRTTFNSKSDLSGMPKGWNIAKTVGLVACLALSACSLPRGAALQSEIIKNAEDPVAPLSVYPVDRSFLPVMSSWPTTGEKKLNWISRSQRSATQIIAPGDEIDLQIWDGSESPLLGSVGQKSVGLQKLVVDSAGQIFVPYLDQVKISGSSPEQARQGIQDRLAALIPSAQVQLGRTAGRGSSVDLVGGVGQAGNFPMPDQSFTVLSLIAQAGGVAPTLKNPQIRLMRGGNMYGTSVARLFAEPSLDTTLRGGDKVFIEEDKRYFLSLGAAGSQSMYIFTQDSVSALDAMSIIGGVSSSRADPQGILILREYPASAVVPQTPNADGTVPVSPNGPGRSRVVFTLDLTSADGLFSAKNFRIASGDLVLVTESPITRVQTIFGLIGSSLGLARQVDSTVN